MGGWFDRGVALKGNDELDLRPLTRNKKMAKTDMSFMTT
jgi:hypothetical protein